MRRLPALPRTALVFIATVLAVAGVVPQALAVWVDEESESPLAGTEWRLVEFRSQPSAGDRHGRPTGGWRDLIRLESGSGAAPAYLRHTFDGESYAEAERLPAEPEPEGRRVLAGEYTFDTGFPLTPSP